MASAPLAASLDLARFRLGASDLVAEARRTVQVHGARPPCASQRLARLLLRSPFHRGG